MIGNPKFVRFAVLLFLTLGLTACDSSNPATRLNVSTATPPGSGTTLVTGGSITISAAQVVLSHIELVVAGTPCAEENEHGDAARISADERGMDGDSSHDDHDGPGHDGDDDDHRGPGCEEVEVGPLTVNLPLDASTKLVLDALVPPGTYSGVEAKLEAVNVTGTFTDTAGGPHAFTFALNGKARIEIKLPTPVTVGATTSNVTVMVDVASWFKTDSGAVLDPTNIANAGAISRNIRRSFRAFADRNHDGKDDDHDEHDGDHRDTTMTM